jgi:peptidoglycan-associated lipoprotein
MSRLSFVAVAAVALALAGCDSTPTTPDKPPVESRPTTTAALTKPTDTAAMPTGATAGATPQTAVATVDLSRAAAAAATTAMMSAPTQRVVYFDFDSYAIRDEFRPMIEGHARALAGNRGRRMMIEGHTDERGGREYNLALGQRRAEAVVRSLALLGASETQLEAVSYGKERPASDGHDESAWAKNRRAELKDR